MKVFTKQSVKILDNIEKDGFHVAKREFLQSDLKEHQHIMLELYNWLSIHAPNQDKKPSYAKYPIWVALDEKSLYLPENGYVILELEIPSDIVVKINVKKWSDILNYSYIPIDEKDLLRHKKLLRDYGVSDTKAYMSQFYPMIKHEIIKSWDRLFDYNNDRKNELYYGIIWEIRKEWIVRIL